MSNQLGKFEAVALREVWRREDGNFTPWLASNLSVLGDALGLPLEIKERESELDGLPYRVDIVAASEGQPVVIENQLEPTDDDHLGRLLIYAAGKNAKTVIWVASEMADAHWQAMHWLNQQQGAAKFYGVVVELLKIGASKPAPYFKVVVAPGDLRERNTGGRVAVNAGLERAENHIFSGWLLAKLRIADNSCIVGPVDNNPWAMLDMPNASPGVQYALDLQRPGLDICFQVDSSTSNGKLTPENCWWMYDHLAKHRNQIEATLGSLGANERLDWQRDWRTDRKARGSQIVIQRDTRINGNYDEWPEYQDWIISRFLQFREVLKPHLTAFRLLSYAGFRSS